MQKLKLLLASIISILILNSCDRPAIFYGEKEITVEGENTISNTLIISPGTKVYFMTIKTFSLISWSRQKGKLTIKNGGKILAQGTKGEPIIFETDSMGFGSSNIEFSSNASDDSILEYCKFNNRMKVNISNSMTIQYCKFDMADSIEIKGGSNSKIKYNFLNGTGIGCLDNSTPLISFNIITDISKTGGVGIYIGSESLPNIEKNNIINRTAEAIYYVGTNSYTVTANYIENCNNKTGIDTIGGQSHNITYVNPRNSPVTEAGCGW